MSSMSQIAHAQTRLLSKRCLPDFQCLPLEKSTIAAMPGLKCTCPSSNQRTCRTPSRAIGKHGGEFSQIKTVIPPPTLHPPCVSSAIGGLAQFPAHSWRSRLRERIILWVYFCSPLAAQINWPSRQSKLFSIHIFLPSSLIVRMRFACYIKPVLRRDQLHPCGGTMRSRYGKTQKDLRGPRKGPL